MSEIRTDTINNASGDNDSGIDLSTNDQVKIKTANTTALTVDASQNVGIGTSSPSFESGTGGGLEINNSSGNGSHLKLTDSASGSGGTNGFDLYAFNTSGYIENYEAGNIVFRNNGSEACRINNNGDLFLGTSTANSAGKIDVEFNGTSRNGIVLKTTRAATGTNFLEFVNSSGSSAGTINHNGSTTVSYNTSSDYRLKENVSYNFDATTRLKQLKPARFNFIADGADKIVDGFLAHEVSNIVPEAITGEKDATKEDGSIKAQGIDQSKLVPLLTKTLQEALTRIDTLEAKVTALENS
jgi:hypothetical protein